MKPCTKCGQIKPPDQFYWNRDARYRAGGFFRPDCKACTVARVETWRSVWQYGGTTKDFSWGYGHHPNSLLGRGLKKR